MPEVTVASQFHCPLSNIGFGAYQIGRVAGNKYASAGTPLPSDEEAERILHGVLDLGITLIDSAPAYGLSEMRIGNYLHSRRDAYNLCTKVGEYIVDGSSVFDFSASSMRTSVENSLRSLQTDHLDILLIHAPPDDLHVLHNTDAVETLHTLKDEGMTRFIGFSGKSEQAQLEVIAWSDVMMIEYSAANQEFESIVREAHAAGICILIKKAMDSGHLQGDEAISFLRETSPIKELLDCTVIGSTSLDRMKRNVAAFTESV